MLFLTLQIVLIEACQYRLAEHDVLRTDDIRNLHAISLLQDKNISPSLDFNGDKNFSSYISDFLKEKNSDIDHARVTGSLMSVSREHAYDPIFLLAVIQTESSFNQNAIGRVGEVGLMQIRPETAEWICKKNNIIWRGATALKDPVYNILVGSHYFRYLKNSFNSETYKYVTAYNTGAQALHRRAGEISKVNTYFDRVIANYLGIYAELKKIRERKKIVLTFSIKDFHLQAGLDRGRKQTFTR